MLEEAELVVFDEFTSVVDRDAAEVSSAAVAKALRRRGRPRLHRSARCWVATWNDVPVAFTNTMPLVGHAGVWREHRTVVLPDFQGVGIGNALSEWLGGYLKSWGLRFTSVTRHPAMSRHRTRSPLWTMKRFGHLKAHERKVHWAIGMMADTSSTSRLTASFEYVGPALGRDEEMVSRTPG